MLPSMSRDPLRLQTWLVPSIPHRVFERIGQTLGDALDRPITLHNTTKRGGPTPGPGNPFSWGTVDLGFISAPMYMSLHNEPQPAVKLVGAGLVFDDPRNQGRPLSWCEIAVRNSDPARKLSDLRGRRFGYNDTSSLTGWSGIVSHLAGDNADPETYFASTHRTGSHLASISQLIAGVIDVATLDSNSLLLAGRTLKYATSKLRILESLGPWPVQPIVVRANLPEPERIAIRDALLATDPWPDLVIRGFAEQDHAALSIAPHAGELVPDSDESERPVAIGDRNQSLGQ